MVLLMGLVTIDSDCHIGMISEIRKEGCEEAHQPLFVGFVNRNLDFAAIPL